MSNFELTRVVDMMLSSTAPRHIEESGYDITAWEALQSSELDKLLVPLDVGGSGGSFADLAVVLRAVGQHGTRVPFAEVSLANAILSRCEAPLPEGLTTLCFTESINQTKVVVLDPVPYGRSSDHVVVISPTTDGAAKVLVGQTVDAALRPGITMAGEPHDSLEFRLSALERVGIVPSLWDIQIEAAASRALLIAGALERIRHLTLAHSSERQQFGRQISRFQAVQQLVVDVVTAAESARVLTDHMASVLASVPASEAAPLVAAARTVTGRNAATSAAAAHQVHGALGFTREHQLHAFTIRALAWREEYSSDVWWASWLGRHLARIGAVAMWELITGVPTSTEDNDNSGLAEQQV